MLKRISIENDLKDIIKGFPDGVLDKVTSIEYYTTGDKEKVITPSFERVNDIIVVAIPSQDLKTLPSGVLYRRAHYTESDEVYPDLTYDLTIVDSMDIWIEADESHSPEGEPYLTQSDMKTINGQSIVGYGDIEILEEDDVEEMMDNRLTDYAQKSEVPTRTSELYNDSGYLTEHQSLADYAKKTDIPSLEGYATEDWVENQGYLTEHQELKTINGQSIVGTGNIEIQGGSGVTMEQVDSEIASKLNDYARKSWVDDNYVNRYGKEITLYASDSGDESTYLGLRPSGIALDWSDDRTQQITEVRIGNGRVDVDGGGLFVDDYSVLTERTSFKTINGQSIKGTGNIEIQGGSGVTMEQVDNEIATKLTGYATQNWVNNNYVEKYPDGDVNITSESGVTLSGAGIGVFLNGVGDDSMSSLALNSDGIRLQWNDFTRGNTTDVKVGPGGLYVDEGQVLTEYTPFKTINGESIKGTGNIVIQGGSGITMEQVDSEIATKLTGYATEKYVDDKIWDVDVRIDREIDRKVNDKFDEKNYATEDWVEDKRYATESYTNDKIDSKLNEKIWVGNEWEWEHLDDEEKRRYTIALIK